VIEGVELVVPERVEGRLKDLRDGDAAALDDGPVPIVDCVDEWLRPVRVVRWRGAVEGVDLRDADIYAVGVACRRKAVGLQELDGPVLIITVASAAIALVLMIGALF